MFVFKDKDEVWAKYDLLLYKETYRIFYFDLVYGV